MKIIDNILDDYFSRKLIEYIITNIRLNFNVDIRTEYKKNKMGKQYTQINILVKPRHYNTYTPIFDFIKGDSFNHLTSLKSAEKDYILKRLREIDTEDGWNK